MLRWRVIQLDSRTGLLVECQRAARLVGAVDARHVDEDVDELGADLVVFHFYWRLVRRDIDLGDHIEQERFLDLRAEHKLVE